MTNQKLLKQARDGTKKLIAENPTSIIILRQQLKNDGFGGFVEDPFGDADEVVITARISDQKYNPDVSVTQEQGPGSDLSKYILTDYEAPIYSGDIFEANGQNWRIGVVDYLTMFGETVGYKAKIYIATGGEES